MKSTYNVFIVGTTSIGKTKLSLALADHLKGEIISCDSMQLYKYADIMTAKATKEEREQAKHHMIDLIELQQLGFNRNMYYDFSKIVFDRLHDEGKCPVIVGGTNYYIETLLFKNQLGKQSSSEVDEKQKERILLQKQEFEKMDIQQRYEMLERVDPQISAKIHRNDHKRVNSYLNKYFTTFKKPSQTYMLPTYNLRDPNTIVFWIRNQDRDQLRNLIKKRIDQMVDLQGLAEIVSIHLYLKNCPKNEGGVLQSIGYKQFESYAKTLNIQVPQQLQTKYPQTYKFVKQKLTNTNLQQHKQLLQKCKQQLTSSTVQYARRQITWIKNRLFGSKQVSNNFFILDITGKGNINQRFENQVKQKALAIIQKIDKQGFGSIKGGLPQNQIQKIQVYGQVKKLGQWKKYECKLCDKQMNGKLEFDQHNKSGQHKKMVKLNKKQEFFKSHENS